MASSDAEKGVYEAAKTGLQRFLAVAREKVMAPFRRYNAAPDATAVYSAAPVWADQVGRIMAALTPALREGWGAANLPGTYSPNDPYVIANLALTYNLLTRVPDEVHALVVREILDGSNQGLSKRQIADRVDSVLDFNGQENWNHRAEVIAQTECNRHYNSAMLAHALDREKQDGGTYVKQWDTRMDGKERTAHKEANGQVQPLQHPYIVDRQLLLFPGDPSGAPENVINCRCGQSVRRVG